VLFNWPFLEFLHVWSGAYNRFLRTTVAGFYRQDALPLAAANQQSQSTDY